MAGEKDVLRALVEEARERGAHPDREAVFAKFLGDDQEEEQPDAPAEPTPPTPAEPKTTKGGK
jgi:hypothetical protein